jgi:hypothetical protein
LQVIDVSDPTHPVYVGGYDTAGNVYDVAVAGKFAYVADGNSGLQVIDVSNPTNPVPVGNCDTDGWAWSVAVEGKRAYVADGASGLQVIDVSNPASPVLVGSYDTSGYAVGVAVKGNRIYIADEVSGLKVFSSLRNLQFTIRVEDVTSGIPCVIEVLDQGDTCTPLFTNPSPTGPFDFVDLDVKTSEHPQKFYRVHQP